MEQLGLGPRKKHGVSDRQAPSGGSNATAIAVVDPSELVHEDVRYWGQGGAASRGFGVALHECCRVVAYVFEGRGGGCVQPTLRKARGCTNEVPIADTTHSLPARLVACAAHRARHARDNSLWSHGCPTVRSCGSCVVVGVFLGWGRGSRQHTLFRLESTIVPDGPSVEEASCVRIVPLLDTTTYLSAGLSLPPRGTKTFTSVRRHVACGGSVEWWVAWVDREWVGGWVRGWARSTCVSG